MTSRSPEASDARVDRTAPSNRPIVEYLQSINERRFPARFEREPEDRWFFFWRDFKPEKRYGSHPDAFERLFDTVAGGLTTAGHQVVYGRDCLVDPDRGLILGFCQGMCYALKLDAALVPTALAAHDRALERLHPGMRPGALAWRTTVRGIGDAWVPGHFLEDAEIGWLAESWGRPTR